MGMAAGPQRGHKSDINVTPLVDVCLVLLIIFMVVTPMLQRGKDVTLPKSHSTEKPVPGEHPEPLIMSVTKDKKMWLDKQEYDATQLQEHLADIIKTEPFKKILLKGDTSLAFGDIRKVMQIAQKAKAKGIELGVEQIKDK